VTKSFKEFAFDDVPTWDSHLCQWEIISQRHIRFFKLVFYILSKK